MPLTPFHYPLAYLFHKIDGRIVLPGLAVGSIFPDAEIPVALALGSAVPHRMVLHSLLGAATLGTILSFFAAAWVYPAMVGMAFPVDRARLNAVSAPSLALWISCLLGNLSHVLLDTANHAYSFVFWPFAAPGGIPSPICAALGGAESASAIVHTLLLALFVALFRRREGFWERLLVG